jgi:hypothetical protein
MTSHRWAVSHLHGRRFATHGVTFEPAADMAAVFDVDGEVRAWTLPDRVVGLHGATQVWLLDGAVYSYAGTHIGSLRAGVFRGTDGLISGYLGGSLDPTILPHLPATLPTPPQVPSTRRPPLNPPSAQSSEPRNGWSSYGWSGFLLPRPLLPIQQRGRANGQPSLPATRDGLTA